MIRDPAGILYATRGADGGFHGAGTFHDWPIRVSLHRATDDAGNAAVSIRIYDGDQISDTRAALGPSRLIDGFGHVDPEPIVAKTERRR